RDYRGREQDVEVYLNRLRGVRPRSCQKVTRPGVGAGMGGASPGVRRLLKCDKEVPSMLSRKYVWLAVAIILLIVVGAKLSRAQDSLWVTGSRPSSPLAPPTTSGPIDLNAAPVGPQTPPQVNVPNSTAAPFEHSDGSVISLPSVFTRQWSLTTQVPPESMISSRYIRSADKQARRLTLKEAVYIALNNNPNIAVAALNPIAAIETIRQANGSFDPNLTSQIDVIKTVVPTSSVLQTANSTAFEQKQYDWNFGINKVSAITNGTWGVTFNNQRAANNSTFSAINPGYTPSLNVSLSQPLLQNFGWKF